jgi:hypothetical protein
MLGPPAPEPTASYTPPPPVAFRYQDFAWSTVAGSGAVLGALAYRQGPVRYSCEGRDVILTPETPWSRRRMMLLYGSATGAVIPVEEVRQRTQAAPSGDYARYVRKTTCDDANHFAFSGLPNGAWYVITVAHPPRPGEGEAMAIMRRIETRGGPRPVTLN